jgi:C-terminal processing protease CtpA/Prc
VDLSNGGAFRLTTARYYTPAGRALHAEEGYRGGIVPDISRPETASERNDRLQRWERESIEWNRKEGIGEPLTAPLPPDAQLAAAVAILRGKHAASRIPAQ